MLKDRSIRISDHSADAWRFKRDNNLSIKLSRPRVNKPFNASANNNVIEATYGRRFLEEHPDVLARMLRDVAEFAATGEFHDTAGASKVEFSGEQEYKNNAIKILIEDARKRNDIQAEQALMQQLPENLRMDAQAQGTGKGVGRFQIERLYTGSAADYAERVPVLDKDGNVTGYRIDNKPSLLKIGTGEGAQVYGRGLYASNRRSVAETYSKIGLENFLGAKEFYIDGKKIKPKSDAVAYALELLGRYGSVTEVESVLSNYYKYAGTDLYEKLKDAYDFLLDYGDRISNGKSSYIYEQTWFTNRAEGDESHLLKWYEPVSKENVRRISEQAKKENADIRLDFDKLLSNYDKMNTVMSSEKMYQILVQSLYSPKAASEFLARADIDGIKYPVDSYGGKTVKDGDKVGWNYVSFRDDNIRVDHKWVDGVAKFGIAPKDEKLSDAVKLKDEECNTDLKRLAKCVSDASATGENIHKKVNQEFGANKVFDLGNPDGLLKGHLPNNPIHLKLNTLMRKRSEGYKNKHPFGIEEIYDIVKKVHFPTILLKNEKQNGIREFFEAASGRIFMVAIKPDGLVNDIATIFPKDYQRLLNTIKTLKGHKTDVLSINVQKAISMLRRQSNTTPNEAKKDLLDAISVLNSLSEVNTQGNARFQIGEDKRTAESRPAIDPEMFVYNPNMKIAAMGETEQGAGGIAGAIEKRGALRPWTKPGNKESIDDNCVNDESGN